MVIYQENEKKLVGIYRAHKWYIHYQYILGIYIDYTRYLVGISRCVRYIHGIYWCMHSINLVYIKHITGMYNLNQYILGLYVVYTWRIVGISRCVRYHRYIVHARRARVDCACCLLDDCCYQVVITTRIAVHGDIQLVSCCSIDSQFVSFRPMSQLPRNQ